MIKALQWILNPVGYRTQIQFQLLKYAPIGIGNRCKGDRKKLLDVLIYSVNRQPINNG
jgi:hypothetical protein